MTSVDEILAGSPLAGLRRISRGGGDRKVTAVRLAERFAELDDAPADSFVVLSRAGLGRDHRLPAGHGPALGGDQRRGRRRGVRRRPVAARGDGAGHRRARRDRPGLDPRGRRPGRAGPGGLRARSAAGPGRRSPARSRAWRRCSAAEAAGCRPRGARSRSPAGRWAPPVGLCSDDPPRGTGVSMPVLTEETPAGHFAAPDAGGESGCRRRPGPARRGGGRGAVPRPGPAGHGRRRPGPAASCSPSC